MKKRTMYAKDLFTTAKEEQLNYNEFLSLIKSNTDRIEARFIDSLEIGLHYEKEIEEE